MNLPSSFRPVGSFIGLEQPDTAAVKRLAADLRITRLGPTLGPLAHLPGTWTGNGFNVIALPKQPPQGPLSFSSCWPMPSRS